MLVEAVSVESPQVEPTRRVRPKRLRGWIAPKVVPKHVQHCHAGTGCREWWIYTWRVDSPQRRVRVPYRCNSWRCEACAPHEAAVLWRRITDACAEYDARGFVYFVLTIDREGYYRGGRRPFRDVKHAYKSLSRMSELLLKRLRRWQKSQGMRVLGSEWFAVVEAHKSGWPHLNLVIHSPQLARMLDQQQTADRAAGMSRRDASKLRGELREMALGAGWGPQSIAERARDREALAGYVTKLAGFADAAAGEIAKITQAPTSAPPRFRRLRSGKGFLPPRQGTADGWTGALIRRQVCNDGMPIVLPLHDVSPEHAINVQDACELEDRLWQEERETLWRRRREVARYGPQAVLGPLVQHWDGDRLVTPVEASLDDVARFDASASDAAPLVARSEGREPRGPNRNHRSGHGARDGPGDVPGPVGNVPSALATGTTGRSDSAAGNACVA